MRVGCRKKTTNSIVFIAIIVYTTYVVLGLGDGADGGEGGGVWGGGGGRNAYMYDGKKKFLTVKRTHSMTATCCCLDQCLGGKCGGQQANIEHLSKRRRVDHVSLTPENNLGAGPSALC